MEIRQSKEHVPIPLYSSCVFFAKSNRRRLRAIVRCGFFLATRSVKFVGRRRRRIILTLALKPIFCHSSFNLVAGFVKRRAGQRTIIAISRNSWWTILLTFTVTNSTRLLEPLYCLRYRCLRHFGPPHSFRQGVTFLHKSSCHSSLCCGRTWPLHPFRFFASF